MLKLHKTSSHGASGQRTPTPRCIAAMPLVSESTDC